MLSIGLMSGTSMDGIDAALIETDGSPQLIKEIAHVSIAYAAPFKILLKSAEYTIKKCVGHLEQARVDFSQGIKEYLQTEFNFSPNDITETFSELSIYLQGKAFTLDEVIQHSTELH